jgi:putative solute:sodium symporter small subunit
MAAQGLALAYLLIVAVYTWQMRKIDRRQPDREQQ